MTSMQCWFFVYSYVHPTEVKGMHGMEQRFSPQFGTYSSPLFLILCYMLFLFLNEYEIGIHTYMYLHFFVMASWTTWMELFSHDFFEQPILMWICRFKKKIQCNIKQCGDGSNNFICNLFNIWIFYPQNNVCMQRSAKLYFISKDVFFKTTKYTGFWQNVTMQNLLKSGME